MAQRDSSDSSSHGLDAFPDIPLCIVCEDAACGVGPFSRHHLCQQHLAIDVADGRKLQQHVNEDLRPYSEDVSARVAALLEEQQEVSRKLIEIEERFAALQESLNECKVRVVEKLRARQEAVAVCLRDFEDVASYGREVGSAEAAGDMAEVCNLAMSMQLSVPDLQVDFERAACVRAECEVALERGLRGLRKLQRMVDEWADGGGDAMDAGVTARPETSDTGEAAIGVFMSHEIKLDSLVSCVSVCTDTGKFRSDPTGRVVPTESAGAGSVALPQSCIVTGIHEEDHLTVLSVDGSIRLRCHCDDINWKAWIRGLHCHRHLVFIAQSLAVTVADLSGRLIRKIHPNFPSFSIIEGFGSNAVSVFVSSGNKIAAYSKETGQMETLITLAQLPHARLGNLAIHDNCILVTDWRHGQVHRVSIDTHQVVTTHPTQCAGFARFGEPTDVVVDSRGRMFVSEFRGHSVRRVAADDGSLLWTLGVPGECGRGAGKLYKPCGLAVVKGEPCEQLVVADSGNSRLLVLNLH